MKNKKLKNNKLVWFSCSIPNMKQITFYLIKQTSFWISSINFDLLNILKLLLFRECAMNSIYRDKDTIYMASKTRKTDPDTRPFCIYKNILKDLWIALI